MKCVFCFSQNKNSLKCCCMLVIPSCVHQKVCTRPNEHHPRRATNYSSSPIGQRHTVPGSPLWSLQFAVQRKSAATGCHRYFLHTRLLLFHQLGFYLGGKTEECTVRCRMLMPIMRYQADAHSPYPEEGNNCELQDGKYVTENIVN